MQNMLVQLEKKLEGLGGKSELSAEGLLILPEELGKIHSYQLFGDDLLAIPANLIIKGDDDEFENPFSFLDNMEGFQLFESEYRPEVPEEFIQIGHLYHGTEIVVLNKSKNSIHIFHVSDIVDREWLKYKLEKGIGNLETFIQHIRPQTVCCLMDPKDASKWDIFEIRNGTEIWTENDHLKYPDKETAWKEFKELAKKSLEKGYKIHYAPKKLVAELK